MSPGAHVDPQHGRRGVLGRAALTAAMLATAVTAEEAQAIGFKKVSLAPSACVTVDVHLPKSEVDGSVIPTGHEENATDQCTRKRVQRSRRWAEVSSSKQFVDRPAATDAAALLICFNFKPACACMPLQPRRRSEHAAAIFAGTMM